MSNGEHTIKICQNITIFGKRTSFRLERSFWDALQRYCTNHAIDEQAAVEEIVKYRPEGVGMASALRSFLMDHFLSNA